MTNENVSMSVGGAVSGPVPTGVMGSIGGGASGFAVLDSDGNSFSVTLSVLDSDGNSFTVSGSVLDSDGNSFSVI